MERSCIAVIPLRAKDVLLEDGELMKVGDKNVLECTVAVARASARIDRTFVSTDDEHLRDLAIQLGAEAPFLRPPALSDPLVGLPQVLHYTLKRLETELGLEPEIVVLLEVFHPFRSPELIDQIVDTLRDQALDSVFTVVEVRGNYWQYDEEGRIRRVYQADAYKHRTEKSPLYKEILGLVCATRRRCVDDENLLGQSIGVVPVRTLASQVDLVDEAGRYLARSVGLLEGRSGRSVTQQEQGGDR